MSELDRPDRPSGAPPSRRERLRALAWSYAFNVLVGALVGWAWVAPSASALDFGAQLFAAAALVSTSAVLALVPAIFLLPAACFVASWRVLGWIVAATWTLFTLALYVDTVIYGLFRYHFNGMVWNVMTTPGAEDAVVIDAWTWGRALLGGVFVLALEAWMWRRWVALSRTGDGRTWPRRALRVTLAVLLLAFVGEKCGYAWADLRRDRRITALAGLFPMYQRFTVESLAGKVLGMSFEARPKVALAAEGILLKYPLEQPVLRAPRAYAPPPNVLLIVVDSLRADMLAPQTMPRTSALAARARVFANHLSGGNATRYGVFSLLYGIHGAYWSSVLEEQTPPVLITSLQKLGYDLRVFSGPSQSYPEFRSTCWVTMEERVEDKLVTVAPRASGGGTRDKIANKIAGDAEVARRFEAWMDERARSAAGASKPPFFCFALIDAPHGSYAWPREETAFTPVAERVDFLQMASAPTRAEIEPVWNMYRNAVRYSDRLAGEMLDALARAGELENTLVLITGDHGEEFFENGFFGHTSNFAPQQVHVACVLSGPGVPPGRETRPTSHLDVAPTILTMLGADPKKREQWSNGLDLLDPPSTRVRGIASWEEMALWIDEPSASDVAKPRGILRIPLQGHGGFIESFDARWRPLADDAAFQHAHAADIARLAQECRRFLR